MKVKVLSVLFISLFLASCGQKSVKSGSEESKIKAIELSSINEENGWRQIVKGYWERVQKTEDGDIVDTYIDNSSLTALEYERDKYLLGKSKLDSDSLNSLNAQGDYYLEFINQRIADLKEKGIKMNPQGACNTNPAFSVGPYGGGQTRAGVASYVLGKCTNGGRASAIAKYNGITDNKYDDGFKTRDYSILADATRYTTSPLADQTKDCGEARLGAFSSTIKRHWGRQDDCLYYN